MRVAALYDVHGNLPALEAVLAEVRREGVDRIVVGGDVLPGPMPVETLDLLLSAPEPVDFLSGNGDADTLVTCAGRVAERVPEGVRPSLAWVAERLTPRHVEAVRSWPSTVRRSVAGAPVLFCHATPRDDNEIFTRVTPEERVAPIFSALGVDVVVCGHTHMPFERSVAGVRVVNPGSVGLPFGEPGAYWALLSAGAGSDSGASPARASGVAVELRRTAYDVAGAMRRISDTGYPSADAMALEAPRSEREMLELFERVALDARA